MTTKHKEFKPFDKVLTRVTDSVWKCDFYSYYDGEDHRTLLGFYSDEKILPYEGNEHLVGTAGEPDEEVELEKEEWVMVCESRSTLPEEWRMRKYDSHNDNSIRAFCAVLIKPHAWTYAIRFSDFNPNDMEETMKHVLCARNGKIIKYKG